MRNARAGPGRSAFLVQRNHGEAAVVKRRHVTQLKLEAAMPMIATALQAQKADYTRLEKIRPSLEDVFVAIIDARDSQTGLQAVSL